MLRNDEALSTTWSDQPHCLQRVNLQLPHKVHFNYTVQTSFKSPIFPFVYLRECHINWLITVFLSHFQKPTGKKGRMEKGKLSMPHSWKGKKADVKAWRQLDVSWRGITEKGCNAAGTEVLLQDGRSGSGEVGLPALAALLRVHRERDGDTAESCLGTAAPPWPWPCSFHLPTGWAEHTLPFCAVHGGHPALLRQMRGSRFSRGVIQFTCILCCIIQE